MNTSTAARHAYDDVLHSKGLLKNERVEQKVARAEETVQDWGKIVNVNGGTVLCAAGDGVIDVVDGVVFVDGDGNDENSEKNFGLFPEEDCMVTAKSRRAALARLSAPGYHPYSPTSLAFPFSSVPSSPSSPPSHVNPTNFVSVSMNLYTLPSTISSPGYQTHRLTVPNVDEATDRRTVER